MTTRSTDCYSSDDLALFLAGGFPTRELPRLDTHLLACQSCRERIEDLWRNDQLQAQLQARKAVQTTANVLRGDESSVESQAARDERFLRQTRRLVDRFLDDRFPVDRFPVDRFPDDRFVDGRRSPLATAASTAPLRDAQPAVPIRSTPDSEAAPSGAWAGPPRIPGLELGQLVGQGGMGIVYEAWDVQNGRLLACKVLSNAVPSMEELERFDVEARATMRLDHPHIIRVESTGAVDGRPYLVMELATGGSLQKMLVGQPQPPAAAAALAAKLADALEHAHARGVLHRDLKPTNILLVPRQLPAGLPQRENVLADYDPKIADFGIAKLLDSRTQLTQTGQLLGTPAFAAPEQFMAEFGAVGPAADIYSLGAILYLMLTGLPPLPEDNPRRMLALVRHYEPVAPRRLRPELPIDLETICLCCLEKRTRWRYRSAGELALDLRRFLGRQPILARPRNRWRRAARWVARNRLASVTLVGLALLSTLSLAYARSQSRLGELRAASKAQEVELNRARAAKLASDAQATQLRTFNALDASNDVEALHYCLQIALSRSAPLAPLASPGSTANDSTSVRSLSKLRAYSILDTLPTIRQRLVLPMDERAASVSSAPQSPRRQLSYNTATGRLAVTDVGGGRVWEIDTANGEVTEHSCAAGPFTVDLEWRLLNSDKDTGPMLRRNDDSVPPLLLEQPAEPPEGWRRLWISPRKDIALALGNRAGQLRCYGWRLPSGRGLAGSVGPLSEATQEIVFTHDGALLSAEDRCQAFSFRRGELTDSGYTAGGCPPVHIAHWSWTFDIRVKGEQFGVPQMSPALRQAFDDLRNFTKATVATVDPSESKLAFGYGNGRVGVIDDIDCGLRSAKSEQLRHPIERVAFSPDSRRLFAYSEAGDLLVLDLDEGRLAIPVLPHYHRLVGAAWSPDSRDIAVLDERGLLTVWRVEPTGIHAAAHAVAMITTEQADTISLPHHWIWNSYLPELPAIVLRDRSVEVWEPSTGRMTHRWPLPRRAVASFPPAERGGLLLIMEPDEQGLHQRVLFNYETGEYCPTACHAPVAAFADSAPTKLGLAAHFAHGSHLELWWPEGRRGPEEIRLDPAFGTLYKARVSPTGRELTAVTRSGQFVVWDLELGAVRFHGTVAPPATDMNVEYSPDGERLYIYGPFGLRSWHIQTAQELPAVESLRKRHVISLDFDMARSRIVTMCDNRSVEIRDYDSLALQHSFSPNSALTEARFGPEPGTIRVGMWNLSDAETNRLYLRELWLPDSSEHGHAEMWDYHSGSRISSVFAFRGFGDRAGYLHSNFGVLGLDSQRRVRFGRWPTRNAYSQDQLIAAGKQFLQRDFASADPRQQLSPRQIVDAWQRISMASAAAQTAPGALPQPALSQPALPQPAPPQPALSQPAPGTVPGMLQSLE